LMGMLDIAAATDEDDLSMALAWQMIDHIEAGAIGKMQIQQGQVRVMIGQPRRRFGYALKSMRTEAAAARHLDSHGCKICIVIDNGKAGTCHGTPETVGRDRQHPKSVVSGVRSAEVGGLSFVQVR